MTKIDFGIGENVDWRRASLADRLSSLFAGDPTIGYPRSLREELIRDELAASGTPEGAGACSQTVTLELNPVVEVDLS